MEKATFRRSEISSITWAEFVAAFIGQYFYERVVQKKALEFANLVQGVDLIWEYKKKFLQLKHFVLGVLSTKEAIKFIWGLS